MKRAAIALALAAALASAPAAAPAAASAAQRDWAGTIVATPEGGFRMGNPEATTRIVEYVSLTCPHCRHFAAEGSPALVEQVRSGRLSFEIRPFPLDIVAAAAAQLNRCAAAAQGFALNDAILGGQDDIFARLDRLSQEEIAAIMALGEGEQRQRVAAVTGIDAIAARHGLDAAAARTCLADQAAADRLAAIKAEAEAIGVQGTPSFTINGVLQQNVHDWSALAPLIGR